MSDTLAAAPLPPNDPADVWRTVAQAIATAGIPAFCAWVVKTSQGRMERRQALRSAAAQIAPPEGGDEKTLHERVIALESGQEDIKGDLMVIRTRLDANKKISDLQHDEIMQALTNRFGSALR